MSRLARLRNVHDRVRALARRPSTRSFARSPTASASRKAGSMKTDSLRCGDSSNDPTTRQSINFLLKFETNFCELFFLYFGVKKFYDVRRFSVGVESTPVFGSLIVS